MTLRTLLRLTFPLVVGALLAGCAGSDFDDLDHRVESASAVFQKGVYHLFMLERHPASEHFAQVLREYQTLFQLCLTQLLLDTNYSLNSKAKPKRLPSRLRDLCQDQQQPSRNDLDPACLIDHSTFENKKWSGFPKNHPLHGVSKRTLDIHGRVVHDIFA